MALSLDLCAFSSPSVHYRKTPAYRLDANQENVKKMQSPGLRPDGSIEGKAEKVCELAGFIADLIGKYGQQKSVFDPGEHFARTPVSTPAEGAYPTTGT